ncbi:MAG: flippase-like domain-containing protein [Alphaproteobacteria bacterium]|nr:flippase-like domain-containing protein [Alphaproteobacteria bacterium]
MLNENVGRRVVNRVGKIGLILCGFGIVTALVLSVDMGALWHDLIAIGFGLAIILILHVALMAIDGMGWWTLLPEHDAGTFVLLVWARWVRESTNLLLPVAQVGGDVVGARLLVLNGVSVRHAGASVILDKLAEGMSQLLFAAAGLAVLVTMNGPSDLALEIGAAIAVIGVAAIIIVGIQRAGGFSGVERYLYDIAWKIHPRALGAIASITEATKSMGRPRSLGISVAQHLAAWCLGSAEVWLALRFMGHPISAPAALVIESLGSTMTAAGFMVPGAIGVQESGYIAIGAALGLPAELGLAMSLVKRARQVLLGLPALASWQASELGWLRLRRHPRARTGRYVPPPSSASNAYVRRAIRILLRPVADTGLTPNHLTALRIITGLAACASCCIGTAEGYWWAGGLWIVSCLFDRADGEFARLIGRCSRLGHLYDYAGDAALNAGIFFAIGIGLRYEAGFSWTIALGAWTMIAIGTASILAETLERRIGKKSFPSRAGFDFDDIVFVVAPVLWSGHGLALLIGGAIGGPTVAFVLYARLNRLSTAPPRVMAAE